MRIYISSSEAEASADEGPLPPLPSLRRAKAGEPSSSKSLRGPVTGQARAPSSDLFPDLDASSLSYVANGDTSKAVRRPRPRQFVPPWIKATERQSRSSIRSPGNDSDASDEDAKDANDTAVLQKQGTPAQRPRDYMQRRSVGFRASGSSPSSSSEQGLSSDATSSSDEDAEDEGSYPDTSDSEEIDWPVAPGRQGRRRAASAKLRLPPGSKGKEKEVMRSIKLAADAEEWEEEWVDVMRKNGRSWVSGFLGVLAHLTHKASLILT